MLQKIDPNALQTLFGARWPQEPKRYPKKVTWITFWTSFWEAQTNQNRWKIDQHFRHVFWSTFRASLAPFWEHVASMFIICLDNFSETAILWKIASRFYETTIFKVWRPQKSIKNQQKIVCVFCHILIKIDPHLDLQNGVVWPPGASQKRVQNLTSKNEGPTFFLRCSPGRPPTAYNFWTHQKVRPAGRFSAPVAASRHRKATKGTYV